jgi:hypothetical protein
MKTTIAALALGFGILFATEANAQHGPRGGRSEQVYQHHRIQKGIRNGDLTRREAAHLKAQQAHIRQEKHIARADGYISPAERAHINQMQNRASASIYCKKHNGRGRF